MSIARRLTILIILFACRVLSAENHQVLPSLPSACLPVSLSSHDEDRDGSPDLIVKCKNFSGTFYYFYRGNADSIYPNSPEAIKHKQEGSFTSLPFYFPEGPIKNPKLKGSSELRFRLNGDAIDDRVTLRYDNQIVMEVSAPFSILSVNSTTDPGVGGCDAGECTLREAIIMANSTPVVDEIHFNIPGPGPYSIAPTSALPTLTTSMSIDGTTQPGYAGAPLIEIKGTSAGNSNGLNVSANSCVIRGLVINRFALNGINIFPGVDNQVEGNFIGTNLAGNADLGNQLCAISVISAQNSIGGASTSGRNIISGNQRSGICIVGDSSNDNSVVNNYIGTDLTGTVDLGNTEHGITISQADNTIIGGTTTALRNVISGNDLSGIQIHTDVHFTEVRGNFIGTDANGSLDLGNGLHGIQISESSQNTIGGITAGSGNLISGNEEFGVNITAQLSTNNEVLGNLIGTNAAGNAALGNGNAGIYIFDSPNNFVGANVPGAGNIVSGNQDGIGVNGPNAGGNLIAGNKIGTDTTGTMDLGNTLEGVYLEGSSNHTVQNNVIAFNDRGINVRSSGGVSTGNLISKNLIFSTGPNFAPIDLEANGPTPNDSGDGDSGPNNFQNYPEVTSFTTNSTSTSIQGTLNSAPNLNYKLEFYSSANCHAGGHGPGKTFIGESTVVTDGAGNASFDLTFQIPIPSGEGFLTATATNTITDDTSEYSACLANTAGLLYDDFEDGITTWTILNGNWFESSGYLIGNEGQRGTIYAPLPWPDSGLSGCSQCTFEVDVLKTGEGGRVFIMVWFQNNKNKIELLMREDSDKWILKEKVGGRLINKKKGQLPIVPNVLNHIAIIFDGTNYQLVVDGTPLITMPSSITPFGNVAFRLKKTGARFQQVLVH